MAYPTRRILLLATVYALFHTPAMAAGVPVVEAQGHLEAVLVRPNSATVERTIVAKIPAGPSRIVLHGLPLGSQAEGMQVSGAAVGRLTIGSVNIKNTTMGVSVAAAARKADLESKLQDIHDKMAQLDVAAAGAKATRDAVASLLAHPNGDPKTFVALARNSTKEATESLRVTELAKRPLIAQVKTVENELSVMNEEATRQAVDLIMDVDAETAGEVHLDVHHDVTDASWSNAYEARLDTAHHSLGLLQVALVRQSTGEDWNNVNLRLSSGGAQRGSAPPSGRGQTLSFQTLASEMDIKNQGLAGSPQGLPAPTFKSPRVLGINPMGDALGYQTERPMEDAPAAKAASLSTAEMDMHGTSVEYSIGGKVSVPSRPNMVLSRPISGSPFMTESDRFRVSEHQITEVSIRSVAVPAQSTTAWIQTEFHLPATAPVPGGQVMLDVDGTRVGTSNLQVMSPGETVVLGFGADPVTKVVYDPQETRQSSEFGLGGRRNITSSSALMTVRNGHSTPWEIRILEPVPVSSDEAIVVNATMDPPPISTRFQDTPGLSAWTLNLAPNEEKRIKSAWTVTAPAGKPISRQTTRFPLNKL